MRKTLFIIALFLASLNLRPAISSVSPLLETIRNEMGMSGFAASMLTTLPVLCMGLFAPSAVSWAKRWGTERSLTLTLALIAAATLLRYYAEAPALLFVTSFLAGIGIAVAGPLLSGFIKKRFADRESSVIGFYSMALVIGAALSAGLAIPLQDAFAGSWSASLAAWGWLAVAALPLWLWIAWRFKEPEALGHAPNAGGMAIGRQLPLRNARAWLLTCFFGIVVFIYYSLMAWLAPVVESMGYDQTAGGTALTLFSIISIPVSLGIPVLINRYASRLFWLLLLAGFELAGLLLVALSGNPWLIAVLLGIGAGGLFPVVLLLPIEEAQSPAEAGSWSAMTQFGGYSMGAIGPLLVGLLHDYTHSFAQPFYGLIGLVLIMMLLMLKVGNRKDKPDQTLARKRTASKGYSGV